MTLRLGSLCSGIGGLELGLERALGCETIWQVELEPHCRAVLAAHWPNAERFEDVHAVGSSNLSPVDIICFGSPCQDLSSAGKRAGLDGPKSRLFYECARVVSELRPEWVVIENVASGASRWVDAMRSEMERRGYASLPVPVSASDLGAPHRRARVFLVAHAQRAELREQPGGGERPDWQGSLLPGGAREARSPADLDPSREFGRAQHAEVAVPPAFDADPAGVASGKSPRPKRNLAAADTLRARREGPGPGAQQVGLRSAPSGWRTPQPDILRVVHGVPRGVDRARDRIAALGNSCTPQQAEVAGHVIRLLIEAEGRRVA